MSIIFKESERVIGCLAVALISGLSNYNLIMTRQLCHPFRINEPWYISSLIHACTHEVNIYDHSILLGIH